jgi:DNA-binding NtrC family response regulator
VAKVLESLRHILVRDVGIDYQWPGNVRELQQAVKRAFLTGRYQVERAPEKHDAAETDSLTAGIKESRFDAETLLAEYCASLYERFGTYEKVARITKLDRRTAKKYIHAGLKK